MIIPELPTEMMRWDDWKAFHWRCTRTEFSTNSYVQVPFVIFDTREVIVLPAATSFDHRHLYKALDLQPVATSDKACPALYLPGREAPVPKAWLEQGGAQQLLVDHTTLMVVGLGERSDDTRVPTRFQKQCYAYFGGPRMPPVGDPVKLRMLVRETHIAERLPLLRDIELTLRAKYALLNSGSTQPPNPFSGKDQQLARKRWHDWINEPLDLTRMEEIESLSDLGHTDEYKLLRHGVSRAYTEVPYLLVKH